MEFIKYVCLNVLGSKGFGSFYCKFRGFMMGVVCDCNVFFFCVFVMFGDICCEFGGCFVDCVNVYFVCVWFDFFFYVFCFEF